MIFNDIKKGLEGSAQGFRRCRLEQSQRPNYRPDRPLPSTCSFSTRSRARKRAISDALSLRVALSLSLSESISNQISNLGFQEFSVLYAHTHMCTCTHTHTHTSVSLFLSLSMYILGTCVTYGRTRLCLRALGQLSSGGGAKKHEF